MMIPRIKGFDDARICKNRECRKPFRPARGLLNFRFCPACTFERRRVKRAFRKRSKAIYADYPTQGFQEVRKEMSLQEKKCGVCGITAKAHIKLTGIDLHLDHVIPARFMALMDANPHDKRNLMWLCVADHGRKRQAEERLKTKESLFGFIQQLKMENWDMELVKSLLEGIGVGTARLPF